jgi:hypothetical protein
VSAIGQLQPPKDLAQRELFLFAPDESGRRQLKNAVHVVVLFHELLDLPLQFFRVSPGRVVETVMGIEQFLGRPVVQIGAVDAQRVQFSYVMSSDLVTPDNRLDGQVIVDHLVADGSGAADAAQGGQERRGRHFVPAEGGQRRRGLVARSSGCRIPKEGIPRGVHTRRVGEPRVVHILNILAGASIEERLGSNRYIVVSHSSTADGGRCVLGQEPSGKGTVASGDATDYRSGPIHSLKHKPLTNYSEHRIRTANLWY